MNELCRYKFWRFTMNIQEVIEYLRWIYDMEDYPNDPSLNGLQIQNKNPETKEIKKIAFAVDACQETISRALEAKADLLIVHHGLFWGSALAITGSHYERVAKCIEGDLALFACHIPLDANKIAGNNFGIAKRLELEECLRFGEWRGAKIGVKGVFAEPQKIEQVIAKLFPDGEKPLHVLPFGKKEIQSVGIISGGAGDDLCQAIEEGLDLYITGEISHENYHEALEAGINVIAGGHYQTETVGVRLLMKKIEEELHLETVFIDVPTGL